jgi:hypothetical protein
VAVIMMVMPMQLLRRCSATSGVHNVLELSMLSLMSTYIPSCVHTHSCTDLNVSAESAA